MMWCFHSFSNAGFLVSPSETALLSRIGFKLPTPSSIPPISFLHLKSYRIPVVNDESSINNYSESIGDFRFSFLRLLFGICLSYRSVSSLALYSLSSVHSFRFVFAPFWVFYTYTSSLCTFRLSSSICIFYLFSYHCAPCPPFPLSFYAAYRNKDVILNLLLFTSVPSYMIADLEIIGSFMDSSPPSFLRLGLNKSTIVAPHRKLLLTSKFY